MRGVQRVTSSPIRLVLGSMGSTQLAWLEASTEANPSISREKFEGLNRRMECSRAWKV
jgi:hypothetical protein